MRKIGIGTKVFGAFLVFLVSIILAIQVTDNSYMYRGLIYNYADIDDLRIFPSRMVRNGAPQPWAVATDYNKGVLPDSVRAKLEKLHTVAYLIIRDDSVRYEEYWEGYGEKSISNSFSMAKSIIGILTGIAIEEGKIRSIDEPIGNYLPQYREGYAAKVTVRHLLMMSSGSSWDESYSNLFSITTKAYYGNDLQALLNRIKIVKEPGKVWEYKSGDTQMLAFLLEAATGKSVSEYASEKLWSRIGAESPAQWSLDQDGGHEKAFCCIYAPARDFARIGKLMLDSGAWNGEQIVPKEFMKAATTPNGLIDGDNPDSRTTIYGYQWWLMNYKGHDIFYMRGLLGQYVFVIPDERMIVVRLGKKREASQQHGRPVEVDYIIQGALSMYGSGTR